MARKEKTTPVPNILEGYDRNDPASLTVVENKVRQYMKLAFLKMNRAQIPFIRIKNNRGKTPRTRLFESGNQVGKTSIGVAEDIAHMMGFRPWLSKDDPDYKINVRVPNNGLVGCEVAGQTLTQRIEPEFMSLIPAYCGVTTTRYSDGSMKSLTIANDFNGKPCNSTAHFRSYVQSAESFEGMVFDWEHFDEPPPQEILTASMRGLMSTNGPNWFTMTPLKEPYIYDLLSMKAFNNGGSDQDIAVFQGSTWDNCQDYCRNCDVTIEENNAEKLQPGQERPVDYCPKCGEIMGFLPRAGIDNYLKNITDPDEREAREFGKWKHLSGMVYKMLDRNKHLYEDFKIPSDWMRIEAVDPADARPTRWIFGAISPEDIIINGKPANRIYWYAYLLPQGSIESIAQAVKVKRAEHGYREPEMVIIDVKFAAAHKPLHGETFSSWEEKLADAGINRMVMSRSNPGDVSLGHKMVKEYLADHYSAVRGCSFPGMMFAREGCKGDRGPIQDMWNYQWSEGSDKPKEDYKDFPDTIRYAALEQPTYRPPRSEIDPELARMLIQKHGEKSTSSPLFYGLPMRG